MGVRRAVEAAEAALKENQGKRVFALGPLIHNPLVMTSLEKKGLTVLSGNDESDFSCLGPDSLVIIRAHGTTPKILCKLKERGACIVDATCPRVHLSQKRAAEWAEKGYTVIIAGDKNHGEVTGIAGFAQNKALVVENAEQALSLELPELSVLIAQTTFSQEDFAKIKEILVKKNPKIKVFDSICSATKERQDALSLLRGRVEGILVVGGKNSANTRRLYETALTICPRACLIEEAGEIPKDFFTLSSVGITAGASTPEDVIISVENALNFLL